MAIQKAFLKGNTDNSYKTDFNDCYYKIDACDIDVNKEEVRIGLRGYASEYAREQEDSMGIYKKVFHVKFSELKLINFSRNNILAACYEWLMDQEEFKTGVPC